MLIVMNPRPFMVWLRGRPPWRSMRAARGSGSETGCYVDLLSTAKEPEGMFPAGEPSELDGGYVDVPPDDYRAIRRAVLDLTAFYGPSPSTVAPLSTAVAVSAPQNPRPELGESDGK
ncbi:hypothetical protein P0D72_40420 [Paraburkholderia sediminicola]|uniref:hypothetical protein n=1 Tax=Paraburkholderia sediminicola TaxID=458836 RepID=UPI0038BD8389